MLQQLPSKLQAEIATHVHFETLKKVRIFQDTEAGLLAELVLKLKLQVLLTNTRQNPRILHAHTRVYISRRCSHRATIFVVRVTSAVRCTSLNAASSTWSPTTVTKVCSRQRYTLHRKILYHHLQNEQKVLFAVFVTLGEGAVFGELSILNIAGSKNGNRRTANVRSRGYSDLFALSKDDLWDALKEYPDARKLLIQKVLRISPSSCCAIVTRVTMLAYCFVYASGS